MQKNPSTAENRLEITVAMRNFPELLLNSGFFAAHDVSMHIHCESLPQQPIGDPGARDSAGGLKGQNHHWQCRPGPCVPSASRRPS